MIKLDWFFDLQDEEKKQQKERIERAYEDAERRAKDLDACFGPFKEPSEDEQPNEEPVEETHAPHAAGTPTETQRDLDECSELFEDIPLNTGAHKDSPLRITIIL